MIPPFLRPKPSFRSWRVNPKRTDFRSVLFSTTSPWPFSPSSKSVPKPLNEPDRYDSVVGTVPYHMSYTLLQHPKPPSAYPSRLDADFSGIGRELMVQAAKRKAIVNFWWDGSVRPEDSDARGERYPFVTFFFPASEDPPSLLSVRTRSGDVASDQDPEAFFDSPDPKSITMWSESSDQDVYLLVCTHGSRDCRCSDRGGILVQALRSELTTRRKRDGEDSVWKRLRVGEIAHVGGHKYAANLLVFPFGDWLAQVTPELVPQVLDAIASRLSDLDDIRATDIDQNLGGHLGRLEKVAVPLVVDKALWRGRSGLTKDEQMQLYDSYKHM